LFTIKCTSVPNCIERFAEEQRISVGQVIMLGGIIGGQVVVGPRRSDEMPLEPMLLPLDRAHEAVGVGIIAPDGKGEPTLHIQPHWEGWEKQPLVV
jgi:hypothetical protein